MVLSHTLFSLERTFDFESIPVTIATNIWAIAYSTTVVIDIRIWDTITSWNLPTESSTAVMTITHRQAACEDKKYFQNVFDFILNVIVYIILYILMWHFHFT